MLLVAANATAEEAQRLIVTGAAVVAESCGCGGQFGGCAPEWVTGEQLREPRRGSPPRFSPAGVGGAAWIDVWANDERTGVFAHGTCRGALYSHSGRLLMPRYTPHCHASIRRLRWAT